jgi:spore coat polysaccharide biosynthesis protein SpsF
VSRLKIGVAIQARMGSRRCPGKVLHPVCGKPLLGYLLEGLRESQCGAEVVVATSREPADDQVAEFCDHWQVRCVRGPHENVAERFVEVLAQTQWDAVVRISGDSPLLDFRLIDRAVQLALNGPSDLVTNVFPRGYPAGQSVELITAAVLLRGYREMTTSYQREHVTPYFYAHCDNYRIINFAPLRPLPFCRLTVDTPADLPHVEALLSSLDQPHWRLDVLELARRSASLGSTSTEVAA